MQKRKVEEFRGLTLASDKQARAALKDNGWDVAAAAEWWFANGLAPEGKKVNTKKINTEFDRFVDKEAGVILLDGLVRLCEELEVDPETEPTILIVLHLMDAPSTDNVSRDNFMRGMQAAGVSTVEELKAKLPELKTMSKESEGFATSFWSSAFRLNTPDGMRVISGETARALLDMIGDDSWPLKPRVLEFFDEKEPRTITRDTWRQLRQLMANSKADLSDYDDSAAWPVLIDDFVDWAREKGFAKKPDAAAGGGGFQ